MPNNAAMAQNKKNLQKSFGHNKEENYTIKNITF